MQEKSISKIRSGKKFSVEGNNGKKVEKNSVKKIMVEITSGKKKNSLKNHVQEK